MDKIAVTMPGKIGDALYSLPAARYLCKKHNKQADFWTSSYCAPLKNLMEYQSCIDKFCINYDYVIEHQDMGIQPWYLPVPDEYEAVYHLGIRSHPKRIATHICENMGIKEPPKLHYEYPDIPTLNEDYVIVAARGETFWIDIIKDLTNSPDNITVVQIGAQGDYVGSLGVDKTGLDFLETTAWIAKCKVFMGCMSSQLVLAEAFSMPRYVKLPFHDTLVCNVHEYATKIIPVKNRTR